MKQGVKGECTRAGRRGARVGHGGRAAQDVCGQNVGVGGQGLGRLGGSSSTVCHVLLVQLNMLLAPLLAAAALYPLLRPGLSLCLCCHRHQNGACQPRVQAERLRPVRQGNNVAQPQ